MKFFHMADLHLGKKLLGEPLWKEQQYILSRVVAMSDEEKPEAVLLCGDIYDKSIPSSEAVGLLDWFLEELSVRGIQTFLISGNHDGAQRLQFASGILKKEGIHIAGTFKGGPEHIVLSDAFGPVHVWMLPFLRPGMLRPFAEEIPETYEEAVKTALHGAVLHREERNLLLAHQFVTAGGRKPEISDSEQRSLGGIDQVDASVFGAFDYVALGHIHGPQNIGSNRIRYCGTPLKYSFSEAAHHKSVTVVSLGEKGDLSLQLCPLYPKHDLREIRGSFASVTDREFYANTDADDYLHIILTDEEDVPEAVGKLRQIYPNLMKLSYDNTRTRADHVIDAAADVQHKTSLQLFEELYELQNNQPMSEEQRDFAQNLIERIREEHA